MMNNRDKIIWLVVIYISVTTLKPTAILGLVLFSIFHELGHAVTTSYYGAFRGFTIYGISIATKFESDLVPENRLRYVLASGMVVNMLTMPLLLPLGISESLGVLGYLILVIGCGLGDIYCMTTNTTFKEKVEIKPQP
jgi:hypothetical protein